MHCDSESPGNSPVTERSAVGVSSSVKDRAPALTELLLVAVVAVQAAREVPRTIMVVSNNEMVRPASMCDRSVVVLLRTCAPCFMLAFRLRMVPIGWLDAQLSVLDTQFVWLPFQR